MHCELFLNVRTMLIKLTILSVVVFLTLTLSVCNANSGNYILKTFEEQRRKVWLCIEKV